MSRVFSTAYRNTVAASLDTEDVGSRVQLAGWVHRRRDLGGLVFVDLRDRTGLVQVSYDPAWAPADVLRSARELGPEDVIRIEGVVERRPEGNRNPDMPTGEIEVRATTLERLSDAEPLPIPVYRTPEEELPAEDLRLRYRYLDLRRDELQRNLLVRHRAAQTARRYLSEQGFLEIETPMLTRRTPEGARDYLVPSRTHPGEFYALPQSPQLYKQLLMVSGFDRYFQIARCLRDEDLRADRQPEFTQIDAEMSFVDEQDVFCVGEGLMAAIWLEILGIELMTPFPRLSYADAMATYGTDKPDLRFGLPILDMTEVLQDTEFRVFQDTRGTSQRIRGIRAPGGARLSRRELDELGEAAKRGGAPGVLWVKLGNDGFTGPFARSLGGDVGERFAAHAGLEPGDIFVAVVGHFRVPTANGRTEGADSTGPAESGVELEGALDEVRRALGRKLDLIDESRHEWVWITDFPLFDWDSEDDRLVASHHPFTMPHLEDLVELRDATAGEELLSRGAARALYRRGLRSRAYDAVYNGHELASGSVRIHDPVLQRRVFRALGIDAEEAQRKFGFLLEAFRYGVPPHAGFAFGFDRLVMLLAGASSLREVIAFPKTTSARAMFEGAPSPVATQELCDLHLRVLDD